MTTEISTGKSVRRAAMAVAWIAALFSFAVAVLLLANHLQVTRADPLHSAALSGLHKQLAADASNAELKAEIRALDLLTRRAFFSSQAQVRTGAFLLLGGVAALLVALQVAGLLKPIRPKPGTPPSEDGGWEQFRLARAFIGGLCVAFFAAALAVSLQPQPDLLRAPEATDAPDTEPDGGTPGAVPEAGDAAWIRAAARQWPNFRGPGGRGVATYTNVPVAWNGATGEGVAWKAEVPRGGFSSPVVWDARLFLTGGDAEAREVFAYDTATGDLLWRHDVPSEAGIALPEVSEDTGFAAPTPATDGKRVFAIFATGDLVALDAEGDELWLQHLGVPANHYAHSSSLILHDDRLFVQLDDDVDARLFALSPATGEELWSATRDTISWASPICVWTGSRTELILSSSKSVTSYNPKTGQEHWAFACLDAEVGVSPAYADGWVFVCNEYAMGSAIRLEKTPTIAWEWDENLPDASSPVADGKRLIIGTGYGTVSCLDLHSGKLLWEHEFDDGFYASPIVVGDRVYALDLEGVTHVFKLADTYKAVGAAPLGEAAMATPAILDGVIYLRGAKHLFCIDGADAVEWDEDPE